MTAEAPKPAKPPSTGNVQLAPGVRIPRAVLRFTATRSAGPGGQNVNKRNTRVELRLALDDLPLDERPMARLRRLARNRLVEREDQGHDLLITGDEHRTQLANKRACLQRLRELIEQALVEPKPRKPTKPSRAAKQRRLEAKRQTGQRKQRRAWKPGDDA